jgi:hypothetical protein
MELDKSTSGVRPQGPLFVGILLARSKLVPAKDVAALCRAGEKMRTQMTGPRHLVLSPVRGWPPCSVSAWWPDRARSTGILPVRTAKMAVLQVLGREQSARYTCKPF